MAKTKKLSSESFGKKTENISKENSFYFRKENFKWMIIGLFFIVFGFLLMMGKGANTRPEGVIDPTFWNDGIFSVLRIRIAPLLVLIGFGLQAFAILKRNKS